MDNLDFVRSKSLNNIPQRKLRDAIDAVNRGTDSPQDKSNKILAINRYS